MYHHDDRDYRVAVGQTARRFQAELDELIHESQKSAVQVIERVQNEVPEDRIVHSRALAFRASESPNRAIVLAAKGSKQFAQPLHRHALAQIADRAGIPDTYVGRLLEKEWGPQLLVDNLTTILQREDPRRFLVRSVQSQIRGVLSDVFRRLDSRPILESFANACNDVGAVPVEGVGGELRFCVRAVLPRVFQPGGEEAIAFGVEISNSDFGCGALSLRCFIIRIWCSNYARLEEELRKVHLGRRLDDNVEFSRRTYELDTEAMASATADIVKGALGAKKVNEAVAQIESAMSERIEFKRALDQLPKMGLLKREIEAVRDVYNNGGVEELPPGDNLYRMSNALSWVAKSAETPERRLELEQVAGELLTGRRERGRLKEAA
jgi:hypothetical protein